jgi:hypothetical protein
VPFALYACYDAPLVMSCPRCGTSNVAWRAPWWAALVTLVPLVLLLVLDSRGTLPREMETVTLIGTAVLAVSTFVALFGSLFRNNQCRDCGAKWR